MKRSKIIISGIVQGVGFRPFLFNFLKNYNLTGTIKNTGNLGVTLYLQSVDNSFNFLDFQKILRDNIPKIALIEEIQVLPIEESDLTDYSILKIIPSNPGTGKGLTLPPDIGMCDRCYIDFINKENSRFYHYPFIACAECGPRFTIMRKLPYDRPNSTVDIFPFCEGCENDYIDNTNRRFHAQTFNCNNCGPFFYKADKNHNIPKYPTPFIVDDMITQILNGKIIGIKGIGGVNIVCRADNYDVIETLRTRKKQRRNKPFAVMFPDINVIEKFCYLPLESSKILQSFRKPILLLEKKNNLLPENIAPGLPNIGALLPYMGIHYCIFEKLGEIPLIFTSGNESSIPMEIDNVTILDLLKDVVDEIYLHNREIFQRCDDSVIRPVLNVSTLIRRSRGFVPEYHRLPFEPSVTSIIATGAELNSTGAISRGRRIFPTQHIGNIRNLETYEFLSNSITHMKELLQISNSEIQCIAHDMHPLFLSTKLAKDFAEQIQKKQKISPFESDFINNFNIEPIQHHHAHLASLMVDHSLPLDEKLIVITIDGVGYGEDGTSWGGEVLFGGYEEFQRLGHLKPTPMIGGDICAKSSARMLACIILSYYYNCNQITKGIQLAEQLGIPTNLIQGSQEWQYLIKQFQNKIHQEKKIPKTSSLGRYLDAIASLFNICHVRTYRGEPAMQLEGYIWKIPTNSDLNLKSFLEDGLILGEKLLCHYAKKFIDQNTENLSNTIELKSLASSIVHDITKLFAYIAIEGAKKFNVKKIGVSGGVAYNEIIMSTLKTEIEKAGYIFLQHNNIPPGDAGISTGQIAIAAARTLKKNFN